jgi:hypothetical protein
LLTSYSGIHWASTIPAFLALACLPFPFLFYKYGAAIRKKCKYAAEAEAFMAKIRGQQAARDANANAGEDNSSRTASVQAEEDAEQEAIDYSYKDETEPGFEEMKTQKETEGLQKVRTGRSGRSVRTNRSGRPALVQDYYDNPYEIDRVNTRESFRARPQSRSSRLTPTVSRSSAKK